MPLLLAYKRESFQQNEALRVTDSPSFRDRKDGAGVSALWPIKDEKKREALVVAV